jgi:hypothetical protein
MFFCALLLFSSSPFARAKHGICRACYVFSVLLIWKEFEFLALIAPQPKCGKEIISLVLHSLLERNPSSIQFSKYGRRCTPLKKIKICMSLFLWKE